MLNSGSAISNGTVNLIAHAASSHSLSYCLARLASSSSTPARFLAKFNWHTPKSELSRKLTRILGSCPIWYVLFRIRRSGCSNRMRMLVRSALLISVAITERDSCTLEIEETCGTADKWAGMQCATCGTYAIMTMFFLMCAGSQ